MLKPDRRNKIAMDLGEQAFHAGIPLKDNPYNKPGVPKGAIRSPWWQKGWKQAEAESSAEVEAP